MILWIIDVNVIVIKDIDEIKNFIFIWNVFSKL